MQKPNFLAREVRSGILCLSATLVGAISFAGAPQSGQYRALHLSPNAGPVDVFVNDAITSATNLQYLNVSDILEAPPGQYDIDVVPSGQGVGSSVLPIDNFDLMADELYTFVAYDNVESIKGLVDTAVKPAEILAGRISLSVYHTAPGVGDVNLLNLTSGTLDIWAENISFGSAITTQPGAGQYTIALDTDDDLLPDVIYSLPDLPALTSATVFVVIDQELPKLFVNFYDNTTALIAPDPVAQVRVAHLSPDAPNVDIYLDGEGPFLSDVPYQAVSNYFAVPVGSRTFDIVPTGDPLTESVVNLPNIPVEADKNYTAYAYDLAANIKGGAFEDDYSPRTSGNFRVQAIHTANGVGEVDVLNVTSMDENILIPDLPFGGTSGFTELPEGEYRLGLDANNDSYSEFRFSLPNIPEGPVIDLFAVRDDVIGPYLFAVFPDSSTTIIPADPSSSIRFLHASPDAEGVDIYINGVGPVLTNVFFTNASSYFSIDPDAVTIDIVPAGDPLANSVLNLADLPVVENEFYTAAVINELSSIEGLLLEDDLSAPPAGDFRARAVHAATGVSDVDVLAIGPPNSVLFSDLLFASESVYGLLDEGQYTIGLDLNNDVLPEYTYELPFIGEGNVRNIFAVRGFEEPFLLIQDDDSTVTRIDAVRPDEVEYTFDTGDEAWTFMSPSEFSASTPNSSNGSLDISLPDNQLSFAFWESPPFLLDDDEPGIELKGEIQDNRTYRVEYTVSSDVNDPAIAPTVRLRASSSDFIKGDVMTFTSSGDGSLSPSINGMQEYAFHFFQSPTLDQFLLSFDGLNFDALNAATPTLSLESARIENLGPMNLDAGQTIVELDLTQGTQGFTQNAPQPFVSPQFFSGSSGLTISGPNAATIEDPVFGFWGLETNQPIDGGETYIVRFDLRSAAQDPTLLPVIRLRINESSYKVGQYINLEPIAGRESQLPLDQELKSYYLIFEAPMEIDQENWTFSFDYLATSAHGTDPTVSVSLESLRVNQLLMMSQ